MRDLTSILRSCFNGTNSTGSYHHTDSRDTVNSINMVLPINKSMFELPVFALDGFLNAALRNYDFISASLMASDNFSTYKSIDSLLRDGLGISYNRYNTVKIIDKNHLYYATLGAIFKDDLTPMMMLSWVIKREEPAENTIKLPRYTFVKPVVRIAPEVMINKNTATEKYIANKVLSKSLSLGTLGTPYTQFDIFTNSGNEVFTPRIEIDTFPFTFRNPDVPSANTTNKKLLDTALYYLDEVLQ